MCEATDLAQVCLLEKPTYEPEVMLKTRAQLRGFYLLIGWWVSGTPFNNEYCVLAPANLLIKAESSTELSLTFVQADKPRADFYFVNYKYGGNDSGCLLKATEHQLTCKYENCVPSTSYIFGYYAGAYARVSDIWSSMRIKTALTPANCELISDCRLQFRLKGTVVKFEVNGLWFTAGSVKCTSFQRS